METEFSLTKEGRLIEMFEHCFDYFKLEDLAKIVSLSKRFMEALSRSPRILVSMIKKFYLSQGHVHPRLRRYFQILLTKRPKINKSHLSGIAKEIYLLAEYRIQMSKNLIRDVYCTKTKDDIYEIRGRNCRKYFKNEKPQDSIIERKHGGDGWRLKKEVIPEFKKRTLTTSFEMCEIIYKTFFTQFPPNFLEDFKNEKTVLKAGCFISRRQDCEANGGCELQIFDSNHHLVFDVKQHKRSDEIPISWKSDFVYQEIGFIIPFKDLPQEINLNECYMKFIIYGKDERWWAGYYGSRFIAMYIRGDFTENPLNTLLN